MRSDIHLELDLTFLEIMESLLKEERLKCLNIVREHRLRFRLGDGAEILDDAAAAIESLPIIDIGKIREDIVAALRQGIPG